MVATAGGVAAPEGGSSWGYRNETVDRSGSPCRRRRGKDALRLTAIIHLERPGNDDNRVVNYVEGHCVEK
jgi:hypothetical protein